MTMFGFSLRVSLGMLFWWSWEGDWMRLTVDSDREDHFVIVKCSILYE